MLKPETEKIWKFLQAQRALSGFVLLGGSALSLHLAHRQSEDLDFAWIGSSLPRAKLEVLRQLAAGAGIRWSAQDHPVAVEEFESGGLDLLDYQQDYLAGDGVKVSFFTPPAEVLAVLDRSTTESQQGPRLASLEELFRTKALLSARRSRTRDAFDLHVLMTRCGFGMEDYHAVFVRGGLTDQAATGLARLCSPEPAIADAGFEALAPGAPTAAELARFFCGQRDAFERSEAARAWRARRAGDRASG